jgi:F-type H+-transporting ATPase subunit a
MHNPLEQFELKTLLPISIDGVELSLTNSSAFMIVAMLTIFLFLGMSVRRLSTIPGRVQAAGEMLYELIDGMIVGTAGNKAKKYIPFIFTLFMFIITCNLLGMIPYSFTVTSHIMVTFFMATTVFLGITAIGFARHGLHFFSLFVPSGIPVFMAPPFFVIELFAYLVRPVSLSLRLAANMTAGHIVMKVIAGFVTMFPVFALFPFVLLTFLTGFEIFVAILQAYIFTILTCVYLSDAINLH